MSTFQPLNYFIEATNSQGCVLVASSLGGSRKEVYQQISSPQNLFILFE